MGSGHILVYAFDVLMQIYESVGYSQRDAAKSILENNLYGLDIDDRAYQMAYFAVMMKARQYNRRILSAETVCHVYSIQESNRINRSQLAYFGVGFSDVEKNDAMNQMGGLLDTFKDAKEYGSILHVENYDWELLRRFVENVDAEGQMSFDTVGLEQTKEKLRMLVDIGEVMARKYEVVVTNPPYMGGNGMNGKLSEYCKKHYSKSKTDLYSVFIEKCRDMLAINGLQAMITQQSWMFLGSFSALREFILKNSFICNMVHLGARAFDEISGEVVQTTTFVMIKNQCCARYLARYYKIIEEVGEASKERAFLKKEHEYDQNISELCKIPEKSLGYWFSNAVTNCFEGKKLFDFACTKQGFATGNNDKYLRIWYEISALKIGTKWYPCNKGGAYRKWYGNNLIVANWENDGISMKQEKGSVIRNPEYYFKKGMTWSSLGNNFGVRFSDEGFLFESKGSMCFPNDNKMLKYLLGIMNAKTSKKFLEVLAPTLDFHEGPVSRIPIKIDEGVMNIVDNMVEECILNTKSDWDAFEQSWDFIQHPLIRYSSFSMEKTREDEKKHIKDMNYIEDAFINWKNECFLRFNQLKTNEEELNRIFIDIYGLQDELTPEVEDKDVTIRKADLQRDIKSLISYAVGCMFGRYSLDVRGLAYAGGDWDDNKYSTFIPDRDNIIPITDEEYFEDDILGLFCGWLKKVYGKDTLEQNLDFIASALSNKGSTSREIIRNYFVNDFFKDHCATYSVTGSGKRPIYWLFDSGKQNGFKALIYLHRYNVDTIGNLRVDYLHRMQRVYESEIERMQDMIDHSTNSREVGAATKRKEKLQKQLKECRDYDEKIGHLALSRIELDLDDGIKVNYRKIQTANDGRLYEVLADSKIIMANEK